MKREYSPLLAIRDAYPKMIIARTHHETYDYKECKWLISVDGYEDSTNYCSSVFFDINCERKC